MDSAFLFLKKAYHLAPTIPQTNRELSYFYFVVGLDQFAQTFIKRASELDPLDPVTLNFLGFSQLRLGQLDKAKSTFSKLVELNNSSEAHYALGMISVQEGDIESVRSHLAMIKGFKGRTAVLQAALFAMEGKKAEALAASKPSLRVFSVLGMKHELLARMDTLSKEPQGLDPAYLINDKIFDIVRNEPQFQTILDFSKKRNQEKLKKYGSMSDQD
jgi:tetratricopeptide (TPR) repeat protein